MFFAQMFSIDNIYFKAILLEVQMINWLKLDLRMDSSLTVIGITIDLNDCAILYLPIEQF